MKVATDRSDLNKSFAKKNIGLLLYEQGSFFYGFIIGPDLISLSFLIK